MPGATPGHAPSFADALAAAHADTSAGTSRAPRAAPPSAPCSSARPHRARDGMLRLHSPFSPAAQRLPVHAGHAKAAPAPRRSGVRSGVRSVPAAWVRLALVAVLLCTHTTLALFDPGEPMAVSARSPSAKAAATLIAAAVSPAGGPLRTAKAAPRDMAVAPRRGSIPPGCHRTTSFLADVCPAQGASATSSAHQLRSELILCPLAPVAPLSLDKPVGDAAETTWAVSGTVTLPRDPQAVLDLDLSDSAGTVPSLARIGEPSTAEAWPKDGEEGYWRQVGGTSHWVPAAVPLLQDEAAPSTSSGDLNSKPAMFGPREPTADEAREAYSIWSESVGGEGSDTWLSFAAWRAAYEEAQRDAAARERDEQRKTKNQARRRDDARDTETARNASSEPQSALPPSQAATRHLAPSAAPASPAESDNERESRDAVASAKASHVTLVAPAQGADTGAVPAVGNPASQLATLKHRWNFASLDCAAVVHRSNPSARFASSILSEKKDRYMLSPCPRRSEGQFVIVELCDEISIDTLVLANYEFFSRMFKRFRVRVARNLQGRDEEWQDIGTFRARNVRGLQVFNTVAPKSDARFFRYLRIDFLEHYGSEYYCPVSLLRVYGLTQMDDYIREEEELRRERDRTDSASRELDSFDEIEYSEADNNSGEPGSGEQGQWQEWSERIDAEQAEHLDVVSGQEPRASATHSSAGGDVHPPEPQETIDPAAQPANGSSLSPASASLAQRSPVPSPTTLGREDHLETAPLSSLGHAANGSPATTCRDEAAAEKPTRSSAATPVRELDAESVKLNDQASASLPLQSVASSLKQTGAAPHQDRAWLSAVHDDSAPSAVARSTSSEHRAQANHAAAPSPSLSGEERNAKAAVNASSPDSGRPALSSSASSSSSAASTSPSGSTLPVGSADGNGRSSAGASSGHGGGGSGGGGSESIYRTITKRLNALEANATLSLQYIEHSGQTLREVFARMERRQEERMGDMLRALNASNWRQIEGLKRRQQVDLQQAIFEFDVHRQQTDAERSRLVAELHILANEVLHEKRFGIAQLVLLLILFIFMALTRGSRTAPLINSGLARISGRTRPKGSALRQADDRLGSRTAVEQDTSASRRRGGHALSRDRPEHMQHTRQPSGGARVSATTRDALRAVQDLTRGAPQKQLHVVRSASRSAIPARLYSGVAADSGLGRTSRGALVEVPLHRNGSRGSRGRALRVSVPVPTRADFAEMSRDELGAWLGLLSPANRSPQRERSPPSQALREADMASVRTSAEGPRSRAASPKHRGAGHSAALTSGGEESMSSDWGTERSDDDSAVSEDGEFDVHAARMVSHDTEMPLGRDPIFGSQDTLADTTNTLHLDRSGTASPPGRSKLLSRMMNAARPSSAAPAHAGPEFASPLSAAAGLESDADDEETAPRWIEVRPRRAGSCRDARRNSGRPGSAASFTSPAAAPTTHYQTPGSPHSLGARTPLRAGTPSRSVPRSFASPAGPASAAADENVIRGSPELASAKLL